MTLLHADVTWRHRLSQEDRAQVANLLFQKLRNCFPNRSFSTLKLKTGKVELLSFCKASSAEDYCTRMASFVMRVEYSHLAPVETTQALVAIVRMPLAPPDYQVFK